MLAGWCNLSRVLIIMTYCAFVDPCCLSGDITMSYASVPCSGHDDARQHHLYWLLQSLHDTADGEEKGQKGIPTQRVIKAC